ncbi:UDP-glucose 6-dehydrogenase [Tolypocladium capitatum]|uniref:UDP-glucose 6-dehydrogenase n=1 Tax=Tolypocladium capitatum TaxID=45235 RepID=A0A2K3PU87_9HYPO|nr:UDP-glucose 6-dehydrogenase [Tolypocladium capitatum]
MLPFFKHGVFARTISLHNDEKRFKSWRFNARGYYDLTPPSEVPEPEAEAPELELAISEPINGDAKPLIAVIGVGYVGEHLVNAFSKRFGVLGYDVSETRKRHLERVFAGNDGVKFTTLTRDIAAATHFLISVPTLLLPDKTIDSSFLHTALGAVGNHARRGSVVVIESSVAVGMTREFLGPLAKEKGLFAGMSPERVDPGRVEPPAHVIPKIISGLDDIVPGSLDAIRTLYSQAFDTVVPVSSPEVAEMTKLYENCQRMVCIAYANEMADACRAHAIDPFEVCGAAATKPFGYMPFRPGLGVGGHCIPVNPHYLLANNEFPLLRAATERMRQRPADIAQRAVEKLDAASQDCPCQRVLVVGVGFKPGQAHVTNSPGLELAKSLLLTGRVDVTWIDPLVAQEAVPQIPRLDVSEWTVPSLGARFEMIIVALRQQGLDLAVLEKLQGVQVEMWCPHTYRKGIWLLIRHQVMEMTRGHHTILYDFKHRDCQPRSSMSRTYGAPPARHMWENIDPEALPPFLQPPSVNQPAPEPPAVEDLKIPSFGGHGTLEALQVSQILEDRGVPCCFCGVSALIYYGAGRVRDDWEICVPSELMHEAESLFKSETCSQNYISVPSWPCAQPGSLMHVYPRFQGRGLDFHFVLVPSHDVHLRPEPSSLQRSPNGLPYPKLHVLIQSFLDMNDPVSLCDVVDGSDVSEQWGADNLDLEGYNDSEWATRINRAIEDCSGGNSTWVGFVSTQKVARRDLWLSVVTTKAGRLGWTRPEGLFSTCFRLRGSPDPWLERRPCS